MPGTNLTREEAATRAALVTVDQHDVELDVTTGPETFSTRSTITFTCAQPGAETFLDFVGGTVEAVTLNGTDLDPAELYADSRVRLPGLAAENVVVVTATGRYTNTGEGLHRFVDPVDDEVYLYSQFEVPDSRRMYPVFEQPDLKARFGFTVTAPAHWQVVSNSPTPQPEPAGEGTATWRFAPTQPISSYITALVAGPYDVVRDTVTSRRGEVPLGIFCRRSLTPYLDADNLFDLTKRGFAFFEDEFDCAYPFEKYDQLFAPEYNMGAMENAGCVTINEMYVFRSRVTEALVERRALTVLHELAHMWFGNLVTMRWWNDLWLNESFAEWASTTCQAEATHWTDAWTTFGTHEKDWAYRQDQLSSTHPIVAEIRDLQDVEVNFDGITYAKGASVLKQLVAYVGREPFRNGLRAYFAKHAWGNTTLDDLLSELEATSGRDLRTWSKVWLETAGVSTLRPVLEVDDRGRIASAAVEQTCAPGFETLRPHTLAIGLYAVRDGLLHRTDRLELDVEGDRTPVPALVGREQPDLLLVNDEDLAYAKIRLDERSLATALAHPRGFTSSLPRSLVLASLWDMTRDAEMGARRFVDVVLETLPGRVRLHAAAHPDRPAADGRALLHGTRAPRCRARLDPRPAVGGRPRRTARQRRPAAARQRGRRPHDGRRRPGAGACAARRHRGARGPHRRLRDALDAADRDRRRRCRRRGRDRRRACPRGHRHRARARGPGPRRPADPRGQGAGVGRGGRGRRAAQRRRRGDRAGLHPPGHAGRAAAPVRRALPRAARHRRGPRLARAGRDDRLGLLPPPDRRRRPARPHPGLARRQPARPRGPAPPRRGEPRPGGACARRPGA